MHQKISLVSEPRLHLPRNPENLVAVPSLPSNVHHLRSGLNIEVRPPRGPVLDQASLNYDRFHPIVTGTTPLTIPDKALRAFEDARVAVANLALDTTPKPYDNVTIVPLGTSSAMPSKYRNGTLLVSLVTRPLLSWPSRSVIHLIADSGTWKYTP